ncbi:hypothetical protein CKO51_12545 [Rhodopirellula sp. SM50]|nr:hypothetical protein [Rhodopirellula sp. SM50]PAY19181.1 hypothetical protein CKO51_12545 [Rhodopirellula sp. SM50]
MQTFDDMWSDLNLHNILTQCGKPLHNSQFKRVKHVDDAICFLKSNNRENVGYDWIGEVTIVVNQAHREAVRRRKPFDDWNSSVRLMKSGIAAKRDIIHDAVWKAFPDARAGDAICETIEWDLLTLLTGSQYLQLKLPKIVHELRECYRSGHVACAVDGSESGYQLLIY